MKRKKYLLVIATVLLSVGLTYQQNISDKGSTLKNDKQKSSDEYRSALKILWTKVYADQGKTLYCDAPFSTKDYKARKKQVNAEHVFPMSWVSKDLKCGTRKQCQRQSAAFRHIESDLHNIYPALIYINKARSSYRFGDIAGEKRQFGTCDFEIDKKHHVAEPTPKIRGEIARSMLYMAYQYQLTLYRKTAVLMQQWDKQNPPGQEEKRRAKIIQREQGRENPFITRYPFNTTLPHH